MKARFRSILLLLTTGLVLVTLGFYYWTTTAHYAVYELKEALDERDPATFYARVDVDRLINSFIDAIASRERLHATGDEWVELRARVNAELAKLLKDDVREQIKRDIETLFSARKLEPLSPERMGRLLPIRNFLRRVDGLTFGKLSTASTSAHLNLILHVGFIKRSYPLVLRLQKEDRWRVIGLDGLATVLDIFAKDADLFAKQMNQQTVEDFEKRVQVRMQGIRKDQNWLIHRNIHLSVRVFNASSSRLKSLDGFLVLRDGAREIVRYPFHLKEVDVKPKEEKYYGMDVPIGIFDAAAQDAFATEKLQMSFVFDRASFHDGIELRLLEDWDQWPLDRESDERNLY